MRGFVNVIDANINGIARLVNWHSIRITLYTNSVMESEANTTAILQPGLLAMVFPYSEILIVGEYQVPMEGPKKRTRDVDFR